MNKKKVITLLVATTGIISLSSCRKKNPDLSSKVTKYEFPGKTLSEGDYFAVSKPLMKIAVGENSPLSLVSFPTSYASKGLTFTSANPAIASVNELGVVTGVSKGKTDISIKDSSGVEIGKSRVAVAAASSSTELKTLVDSITEAYKTSTTPTKMLHYEYSFEYYKKEGNIVNGSESGEIMGYNSETGYFFTEGPYLTYKTEGGAPEVSEGKWVFYPINYGLKTRILHITPTGKRFYDINTANYMSNYDRIIRDIMNFFFVSGEKILDQFISGYYVKDTFPSLASASATKFFSVDDTSLYISYTENGSDTVSADDEIHYYNIPTDTPYTYNFREDILQEGTHALASDIHIEYKYKLGEENWTREFDRRSYFEDDFEETKVKDPDKNGYKQVDSLYDL